MLECTIKKIMKNPRCYIGVPGSCIDLINIIQETTNIPVNHLFLCLKKIRFNNTFRELADDFSIHPTYANCLEIEIQKPSKALNQALTWSDYKKANTIKYLVSCTPNGLVNYISPGFGGRITNTCLVESCDFTNCLEPTMNVMANRGFKHVEQYLRQHGVQLVRPPSVIAGNKLTK